jgi:hypothetical protein
MVDIIPQSRVMSFLVEVRLGPYQDESLKGLVELPDHHKLVIVIGNEGVIYSADEVVTDMQQKFTMIGVSPLFK